MPQRRPRTRPGFTLVELLTVIAIIGILAALLLVAVTQVLSRGNEVNTLNDIRQLASSVNNFKQKYGILPPSKITLCNNVNYYASNDPTSYTYLNAIWPRLAWSSLDWTGGQGNPTTPIALEGDQCLVFFLGGIPFQDPNNPADARCLGFSADPTNPTSPPVPGEQRISFYQFDGSRLYARFPTAYMKGPGPFLSYKDAWALNQPIPPNQPTTDQPYAYFSSGKRQNGYAPAPGDCPSLIPAGPYCDAVVGAGPKLVAFTPLRYVNQSGFQIISAGQNRLFGPGGPGGPAGANLIGTTTQVGGVIVQTGVDDQSNFYDAKLGVSQ